MTVSTAEDKPLFFFYRGSVFPLWFSPHGTHSIHSREAHQIPVLSAPLTPLLAIGKDIPHFIGALGGKDLPLEQGNDNKSYTQLKAAPE